jgi:hypothetical protein
MRRTMAANTSASSGLSLLQCGELLHYAIDRLSTEGADSLSPHDRARLASAAAILKQIHEALEEHAAR